MSSRADGSPLTEALHVAEGGGPCPGYGEKAGVAGVMGDSAGYLQFMSLGFDELGLASADIQFVMPVCPYSKVRVVDALDGTFKCQRCQTGDRCRLRILKLTLRFWRETLRSLRLHWRCHVLDRWHRQLWVSLLPMDVRWQACLQRWR